MKGPAKINLILRAYTQEEIEQYKLIIKGAYQRNATRNNKTISHIRGNEISTQYKT